ncbi:MAG: NADH-quinone oxidoreductase subunit L [Planctomycetota bacterium]
MAHELPAYIPWILLIPALVSVVQNFFSRQLPRQGDWLVVGGMGASMVLSLVAMFAWAGLGPGEYFAKSWTWFTLAGDISFQIGIVYDGITAALVCVVTLVSFLVFLFSTGYMKDDPKYNRFFFWLSFFSFSMLILSVADNLLMLFIGWELVGLSSYKLIGFWSEDLYNAECAKKAFIVTRVGDLGMLIGMLILYAQTDTLSIQGNFAAIRDGAFAGHETLLTLAGIGIFFGAVGKSAQFPLHVWLPDAMAGPTPVSALIHAATMVAAGVYLSARMFPMFTPDALSFIAWTGGITAIIAALIAVTQTDIKKVLAYSTISQLGYMILGVGVGAPWAAMFHLATHAMFKAGLFLGSGSVIHAMHHAQDLKDMGGLRKKMPITFWTFVICTLALAGIPLFAGFYSKDAILFSALLDRRYLLFGIGFFTAFLTAFYMTRLVWLCFLGKPRNQEKYDHAHESPWNMTVPLIVLAVFSIGFWYFLSEPGFADRFYRTPAYYESHPAVVNAGETYVDPEGKAVHHDHPWWFMALALSLGIIGIGVGIWLFKSGKRDEKSVLLPRGLHDLAKAKYYMDEMYNDGVVAGTHAVSRNSMWFDNNVVDGAVNGTGAAGVFVSDVSGDHDQIIIDGAVNLTADLTEGAGAVAASAQTGRIRNYLAAAVGVTAVVIVLLVFII